VDLALDGRVVYSLLTQMTIPTQPQRNRLSTQQQGAQSQPFSMQAMDWIRRQVKTLTSTLHSHFLLLHISHPLFGKIKLTTKFIHSATGWEMHMFTATEIHLKFLH